MAILSTQGQPVYNAPDVTKAPAPPPPRTMPRPAPVPAPVPGQSVNPNASFPQKLGAANPYSAPAWQGKLPPNHQGLDFGKARQGQAVGALEAGFTEQENDFANREALRGVLSEAIGRYGSAANQREDMVLGGHERALSRNLAQARRQLGGTGTGGSLQAGRGFGDIIANAQRESSQGINAAQLQRGQELAQLGSANQANLAQALQERGFTLDQAKSLSELLNQQGALELQGVYGMTGGGDGPSDLDTGIGYAMQAAQIAAMFAGGSDVAFKKNIEPAKDLIEEMLVNITPYAYEYRDPEKHGKGRFVSPMAQDLEKSELGRELVIEKADGKYVDYQRAFMMQLAVNAHLMKEINKLKEVVHAEARPTK